ncbi:MAG: YitT family protein [Oscillospiraceae bacterium]|nr:YitT family protein [Oscillospiraceae bacterium]
MKFKEYWSANRIISLLLVLVGNILFALAIKLFILPANLISCGTTGIALVVDYLTKIPMSTFILVFNLIMLAIGWAILGKSFAMTTAFSSVFYPLALEFLNQTMGDFIITEDPLLLAVFGGLCMGMSLGLVIRGGASTGGMDIPPLILNKFFHIPVSATLWVFDFTIMLSQLIFHPLEDLLYGVLLILSVSFSLNKVMLFGTSRTEIKIISEHSNQIRQAILSQIDRGCTLLHGTSGYQGNEVNVILSVVSNHELPKIQRVARSIDPGCFVIVSRVSEVWGRGFTYGKQTQTPDQT